MGKLKKEHRRKIAKRNEKINQQKKKMQKAQQDFLMKLIEQEKQKGMFNNPVMPLPTFDIPSLGNTQEPNTIGPQI